MKMKKALLYQLIFLISYTISGQDVYVKAEYPAVVNAGEQFTVMWTVNAGGGEFSAPSFNGFYKLMGPQTSYSSSTQIINGKMSNETSYSYVYYLQAVKEGKFVISAEMDPPRGLSTHKLIAGASLLQEAGADVINVADSPMARMRMSAWAVCDIIQHQVGVETTLHFPTRGRNLLRVQGDLLAAHALGLRNIFVVMGDPTSVGDYPEAMDNYDLVPSGLIKLIKQGFNAGIDHSGASIGQPTSFFVGAALNLNPTEPDQEIRNAHRKVQAGADFFLTQPIYRPEEGPAFLEKYAAKYGPLNRPVLVGILPLVSSRHVSFLHNEVPGIFIPEETRTRMEEAGESGAKVGVELAVTLINAVKPWAQGVYLMPQFSRYDLVAEIIENCK